MRRLAIVIVLALLGWQGYHQYQARSATTNTSQFRDARLPTTLSSGVAQYKCDGRTYCSQMTSCEEAMYFLRNCPGVKMDGNNDGVPCEQQWCGR